MLIENGIAMNADKTVFLVSGLYNENEHIIMDSWYIRPNDTLKHLGFFWNQRRKRPLVATIDQDNITTRINEFWAVIHALIKSGIRFCAPQTIIHLFNSLAIPTLTYGLELCNISSTMNSKLDIEARSALKALFDISKYSKNYLNGLFHIANVSSIIKKNKLNFLVQLLSNNVTRGIILNMLTINPVYDMFTKNLRDIADNLNVVLEDLVFQGRKPYPQFEHEEIPRDIEENMNFCIKYWNILPLRLYFKSVLEEHIPKETRNI